MRVVKIEIFTFDELSAESQKKVLEKNININVEHGSEWWYSECWLELTPDQIKSRKINTVFSSRMGKDLSQVKLTKDSEWVDDNKANVDGFYPHYTGLFSWTDMHFRLSIAEYVSFDNLTVNCDETFREFLKVPKVLWNSVDYNFDTINGNTIIEFDLIDLTSKQQKTFDRAKKIFDKHVLDVINHLNEEYSFQTDDDAIKETINSREMEFTAEGETY